MAFSINEMFQIVNYVFLAILFGLILALVHAIIMCFDGYERLGRFFRHVFTPRSVRRAEKLAKMVAVMRLYEYQFRLAVKVYPVNHPQIKLIEKDMDYWQDKLIHY